MGNNIRSIFFKAARIILLLAYTALSLFMSFTEAGVSYVTLLLSAVYISTLSSRDIVTGRHKVFVPFIGAAVLIPLIIIGGSAFVPLVFFTALEILSCFKTDIRWYLVLIPIAIIPCPAEVFVKVMLFAVTALLYMQNNYIV